MRKRTGAAVFTPSSQITSDDKELAGQQSFSDFQATQTERSAMALIKVMRIISAVYLPGFAFQCLFNQLTLQAFLSGLPYLLVWGVLYWYKQYLQTLMKLHPCVAAMVVQGIGHITVVCTMLSISLHFPPGLVQHRIFFSQFLPWFMASSNLYVPMYMFLMFVCPLYFGTWWFFHYSVSFVTPPAVMFGASYVAVIIAVHKYQIGVLWHEHQAVRAIQRERNASQAMQESFRGILSSIFDASCTCDRKGQLREFSSHLQDLLGIPDVTPCAENVSTAPEMQGELNLCSFAATDAEKARLATFFDCACSGSLTQAFKIQCRLRRSGRLSTHAFEANLTAITLREYTLGTHGTDSLLVVLEVQPSISAVYDSTQEDAGPLFLDSAAAIGDSDSARQHACHQPSALTMMSDRTEDLFSMDLSTLEDSLKYSDSHSLHDGSQATTRRTAGTKEHLFRSVETQTMSTIAASDAGVQTRRTAAKPPLPDAVVVEKLRQVRQSQSNARKRSRLKHAKLLFPAFHPTPLPVIKELIHENLLVLINPVWPVGCCMFHTLLKYLNHQIQAWMVSSECRNYDVKDKVQCASCFCLNGPDSQEADEEFCCEFCTCSRFCTSSEIQESSSGASADMERESEES